MQSRSMSTTLYSAPSRMPTLQGTEKAASATSWLGYLTWFQFLVSGPFFPMGIMTGVDPTSMIQEAVSAVVGCQVSGLVVFCVIIGGSLRTGCEMRGRSGGCVLSFFFHECSWRHSFNIHKRDDLATQGGGGYPDSAACLAVSSRTHVTVAPVRRGKRHLLFSSSSSPPSSGPHVVHCSCMILLSQH